MGDAPTEELASSPPLGTLWSALVRLALVAGFVALVWAYSVGRFDARQHDGHQLRLAIVAIYGVIALLCVRTLVRIARRWASGAGIWRDGDAIRFAVPARPRWWQLGVRLQETKAPIAAITAIDFERGTRGAATVRFSDDRPPLAIPSGAFAIAPYALDARLRALSAERGGPLAPIAAEGAWQASVAMRLLIVIVGMASIVTSGLLITWYVAGTTANESVPKIVMTPFFLGVALLVLSVVYRGELVIDERGVFHHHGGRQAFLPWDAVRGRVSLRAQMPGWTTLHIGARGEEIRLTRLLGFGFPLKKIAATFANPPT